MRLQRNGIKDVVSVLWWVALFVLLLGVIAFFVIARGGLGAGWGVGWRGWMLIPILMGVLYVVVGLLVLAGVLFFLTRIKDNLAITRAAQEAAASARAAELAEAEAAAASDTAASVAEMGVEPEQTPVAVTTPEVEAATPSVEASASEVAAPQEEFTEPGEAGRLPGADEVARIAAEMAAIEASAGQASPASAEASTPTVSTPSPASVDAGSQVDLTVIEGIGPVYAQRLREAGITTFAELAEADDELLERITDGNLERVVRDDWRGQARKLSA